MMQLSLSQVATILSCHLNVKDTQVRDIVIDSRKIKPGAIFVALKGDHVDGHDYAAQAQAQGAIAIIAEKNIADLNIPVFVVKSGRMALALIAKFYRQLFPIPVVGITGSCGKTTTTALTASVLAQQGKVMATQGTLNNDLGVPLTLFRLRPEHQFAVIEMGANHLGEIAYLANIAAPTVVVITNAGPVHLEGFGSLQGVRQAKGEIYQSLPAEGIAVINAADEAANYWRSLLKNQVIISFGTKVADLYADHVRLNANLTPQFSLHYQQQSETVQLPLIGEHQVWNALAAAAVGIALGLTLQQIKQGLEQTEAVDRRGVLRTGVHGVKLIDDSYNANPKAFKAAIDLLMAVPLVKQHIVIMGDMGELGSEAESGHQCVGQYAKQKAVSAFYTVGKLSHAATQAFGENAFHFETQQALVEAIKKIANDQTCLLIKGSKSSHMNDVVAALLN